MIYTFSKTPYSDVQSNTTYNEEQETPFRRSEWLNFLIFWRKIKPIVIRISRQDKFVGYFIATEKSILGIKILGSPLPGCLCQHMGFCLKEAADMPRLLDELFVYLSRTLGYMYITLTDLKLNEEMLGEANTKLYRGEAYNTCYLDLTKPEEELFKGLKSGYRTCVRKFDKDGGSIAEDYSDEFVKTHNNQLINVFAKDGLPSPNVIDKYSKLITALNKTNMVYCLRADINQAKNVASSIFVAAGKLAFFCSNASYREYLKSCPNQALMWCAIKYFKNNGVEILDMGGPGEYKENYGAVPQCVPVVIYSKSELFFLVIKHARRIYYNFYAVVGKLKGIRG